MKFENYVGIDKQSRKFLNSWLDVTFAYMTKQDVEKEIKRHAKLITMSSGEHPETVERRAMESLRKDARCNMLELNMQRLSIATRR